MHSNVCTLGHPKGKILAQGCKTLLVNIYNAFPVNTSLSRRKGGKKFILQTGADTGFFFQGMATCLLVMSRGGGFFFAFFPFVPVLFILYVYKVTSVADPDPQTDACKSIFSRYIILSEIQFIRQNYFLFFNSECHKMFKIGKKMV